MKIYNYHPEYKYFTSEGFADPSPLDEPDVWLIPAHATMIQAPNYSPGYIPIFDGQSWKIIKDNRGTWYDLDTRMKLWVDDPNFLPTNATRKQPPDPPEPKLRKRIKWDNASESWLIEDAPEVQLTPEQKLESAGLTVEELKILLGLQ